MYTISIFVPPCRAEGRMSPLRAPVVTRRLWDSLEDETSGCQPHQMVINHPFSNQHLLVFDVTYVVCAVCVVCLCLLCMCGYVFGIEVVIRSSPFHGKYDYILPIVLDHQITQAHDRKKSKRCHQGTGSKRTQRLRPYCCPASISVSGCSSAKAGNSGMPRLKLCMDTTT